MVLEVPIGTKILIVAENKIARKRRTKYGTDQLLKWVEIVHQKYQLEQEGQRPEPQELTPVCSPIASIDVTDSYIEDGFDAFIEYQPSKLLNDETIPKHELITILEHGQEVVVCQGGFGGRGNDRFKSASLTTPLVAEYGTEGEKRLVLLELKLLADVGLVGFPNAGKSTLLSIVTKARPKIASYPFTTLEPHLGVLQTQESNREIVIADIPGLIEGASEGKGLGYDFLRHIENTKALLYVLSLDESVIYDTASSDKDKAQLLWNQYQSLVKELTTHNPKQFDKKNLVSVNKIDLYSEDLQKEIVKLFKKKGIVVHLFSGVTGIGLPELTSALLHEL
ncbi:MAG: GTPase ObgE [Candidatus Pacebacteria bacterium]|nr:GTPase ObgE [Candidatus Paceibacterota bacterium]PIR64232.1 MAG: GTPase ObgE [Candidatus Pacebacteria bacterium CG10_big_fil_rev_8_21_14_0_10_40_26]PIZ79345.1 MAG: GTPase ObgE [Candidatus Pacebacteria bacterium CG_4_10_14_0_2_um_filter_40_20]PJA68998.1 MAG: GTPase ObgE [Candidatus Pacebacteria bacterium CG_4_9_14_3_um_filter_40_12]PJC42309.1 MAG: GTPase ObgE [Candidatus Pacebacteria bacterium CG_4_9_14_0_2_um_filter_40_15]